MPRRQGTFDPTFVTPRGSGDRPATAEADTSAGPTQAEPTPEAGAEADRPGERAGTRPDRPTGRPAGRRERGPPLPTAPIHTPMTVSSPPVSSADDPARGEPGPGGSRYAAGPPRADTGKTARTIRVSNPVELTYASPTRGGEPPATDGTSQAGEPGREWGEPDRPSVGTQDAVARSALATADQPSPTDHGPFDPGVSPGEGSDSRLPREEQPARTGRQSTQVVQEPTPATARPPILGRVTPSPVALTYVSPATLSQSQVESPGGTAAGWDGTEDDHEQPAPRVHRSTGAAAIRRGLAADDRPGRRDASTPAGRPVASLPATGDEPPRLTVPLGPHAPVSHTQSEREFEGTAGPHDGERRTGQTGVTSPPPERPAGSPGAEAGREAQPSRGSFRPTLRVVGAGPTRTVTPRGTSAQASTPTAGTRRQAERSRTAGEPDGRTETARLTPDAPRFTASGPDLRVVRPLPEVRRESGAADERREALAADPRGVDAVEEGHEPATGVSTPGELSLVTPAELSTPAVGASGASRQTLMTDAESDATVHSRGELEMPSLTLQTAQPPPSPTEGGDGGRSGTGGRSRRRGTGSRSGGRSDTSGRSDTGGRSRRSGAGRRDEDRSRTERARASRREHRTVPGARETGGGPAGRSRPGGGESSSAVDRPPEGRETSTLYPEMTVKTLAPRIDVTERETRRDITYVDSSRDDRGRGERTTVDDVADRLDGTRGDVTRVAERVYRELERRRRIERERRGL